MTEGGFARPGTADALVRLSHAVQHVFADVGRDHGVTPQQLQLLCMLIPGPLGMTELSGLLHLERSTTTGLVDRVEKRDLVARVPDPGDRRACRVRLTDEGTRVGVRAHDDVVARLDKLVAKRLDTAQREDLTAAVVRLIGMNAEEG